MGGTTWVLMVATTLAAGPQEGPGGDRIYGRVVTAAGDVFQGFLRWDRNEGSWADLLDGSKELPWENHEEARRLEDPGDRRSRREGGIRIFGLRISWEEDWDDPPSSAASGVRFGHLRSLYVLGDDRAMVELKSGQEVVLEGGSTDLGDELRALVVDDFERGSVELRWRDLDLVEFFPAPEEEAPRAERLWGTLTTRSGTRFTGFVSWDLDEILASDVLDGRERGEPREIPFERIAGIERAGPEGAWVILASGEELLLEDSNDVDSRNRGIVISDPDLGEVRVGWRAFGDLAFHAAPGDVGGYDRFDGGRPLFGTVETVDGERITGAIRWDNDEESTWEILDGGDGAVTYDIELGEVRSIRRLGSWGSEVTLLDGRVLELEGSNDVDDRNKGIVVRPGQDDAVLVRWRDFRQVTFEAR